MPTPQDFDIAEVIIAGINTHFVNVRIETDASKNKWNIYVNESPNSLITNYNCEIHTNESGDIDVWIMPPVTRILCPGDEGRMSQAHTKEFLGDKQIEQWLVSRNMQIDRRHGSMYGRIGIHLDICDPIAIETILEWIEYCGGITYERYRAMNREQNESC